MSPGMGEVTRAWLRRQAFWMDLWRLRREGWGAAMRRWRWWPRILRTPPLRTGRVCDGAPVEVHMICFRSDWLLALWALKSFYRYSGVSHPLVVHLQTELAPWEERHLRAHLPDARIITAAEADLWVVDHLVEAGLPRCVALRHATSFMPKLLDLEVLSQGQNLLSFDSDVLFFRRPAELSGTPEGPLPYQLFQQDVSDNYNELTAERAKADLGVELLPLINTGIVFRAKGAVDLGLVERFGRHPVAGRPGGHTEQTLHALVACQRGAAAVRFLPASYALQLAGPMDVSRLDCRHYAGPPGKPWLALEGMPHLWRSGILHG